MSIFFGDTETLSLLDVTVSGAHKMAQHPTSEITVLGGTYDDEPNGFVWSPDWAWGNTEHSRPDDNHQLERLFDHINEGGYTVWWNAGFDRRMWNYIGYRKYGWPYLPLEQVLCAQSQAEANNLPSGLGKAAECLGTPYRKDPRGKQLIGLLAHGSRETWDSDTFETPDNMGHFRRYCLFDVLSMRDVWNCCRPLMTWEWEEYWASERINDRGVMVDVPFAAAAQQYAIAESKDINADMLTITGDERITVTNHVRKARWLYDQLWPDEELQAMVERPPKKDKPDVPRFSADRSTREAVLDSLAVEDHADRFEPDHLADVIEFLELIEAGNSAAVRKYTAIVNQACPVLQQAMEINAGVPPQYRIHGMYAFNGAGQTGRYSSRGVQTHNLIRDPVEKGNPDRAIDAIDAIMEGWEPEALVEEFGFPVSRLLARLLRPTFIAPEGKILVWGDWEQIEGRVLPWLSDSKGGDAKLDLFESGVDVYSATASDILRQPNINDFERQAFGKVPELALGFGGSVGAFAAMGRAYGVTLPPERVKEIVYAWRDKNAWCENFWHELWEAAMAAHSNPGTWFKAGMVKYMFHPQLMRGTLICQLPCGRWIVYPQFRHELQLVEDDDGNERTRWVTSCVKGFGGGYGRTKIWHGTLAENITQGTAASILRHSLTKVDDECVLHTHDELALEVRESDEDAARMVLENAMLDLPEWATGLPLAVEIDSGPFYTK